jgi:hypothetical protein
MQRRQRFVLQIPPWIHSSLHLLKIAYCTIDYYFFWRSKTLNSSTVDPPAGVQYRRTVFKTCQGQFSIVSSSLWFYPPSFSLRATPRYSTRRQDPLNNVPHMPLPTTPRIPACTAMLCLLAHSHSWASLLRKVTITSLPYLQRHNNLYRLLVTVT